MTVIFAGAPPDMRFIGRSVKKPELKSAKRRKFNPLWLLLGLLALVPFLLVPGEKALHVTEQPSIGAAVPTLTPEEVAPCSISNTVRLGNSYIDIGSTSHINRIVYDPNIPQVRVYVSGDSGTTGETCVNVPKPLLGEKIFVSVTDPTGTHTVQDLGYVNFADVNYHHSERVITITGLNATQPSAPTVPSNVTQPSSAPQQQQQQQQVVIVPGQGVVPQVITNPTTPVTPSPTTQPCPAGIGSSLAATGIPVVFTSGEKPTFTKAPDASGIKVQTKTRAVVDYISDVGATVGINFKLDNLSKEDSLVRVKVSSSDALLVDLIKSSGIDVVRVLSPDEYVIKVNGGATGAVLEVDTVSLTAGFHPFFIEILPLIDETQCP